MVCVVMDAQFALLVSANPEFLKPRHMPQLPQWRIQLVSEGHRQTVSGNIGVKHRQRFCTQALQTVCKLRGIGA